jgi:hypothetical protein
MLWLLKHTKSRDLTIQRQGDVCTVHVICPNMQPARTHESTAMTRLAARAAQGEQDAGRRPDGPAQHAADERHSDAKQDDQRPVQLGHDAAAAGDGNAARYCKPCARPKLPFRVASTNPARACSAPQESGRSRIEACTAVRAAACCDLDPLPKALFATSSCIPIPLSPRDTPLHVETGSQPACGRAHRRWRARSRCQWPPSQWTGWPSPGRSHAAAAPACLRSRALAA